MKDSSLLEFINCPLCNKDNHKFWANENGFTAVKCNDCGLVYVNPRPKLDLISLAVQTGQHIEVEQGLSAVSRRVDAKVKQYKTILPKTFADVWSRKKAISWIDVGAGYGEVVEAVSALSPQGSLVKGLEPMGPKASHARAKGLNIEESYLKDVNQKYDYLSIINVFSHIPDFRSFLEDAKNALNPGGEILIETGDVGKINLGNQVPDVLNLPDHLVFAGESQLKQFLHESGFQVISVDKERKDDLVVFLKNIIKKMMGKQVCLSLPYTSPLRTMIVRARLQSSENNAS